ncbi:hypothetical protein C7S14_3180 [Burkholderia cepacia]|nr:hypothetical protein C7S14_3180 [Burkholderia cepacia]
MCTLRREGGQAGGNGGPRESSAGVFVHLVGMQRSFYRFTGAAAGGSSGHYWRSRAGRLRRCTGKVLCEIAWNRGGRRRGGAVRRENRRRFAMGSRAQRLKGVVR